MRSEREITDWLRARSKIPVGSRLILGIGDDCAVYRPGAREDLLFTTDLFLEDVHFRRATHTAKDAGRVAMARSLSDIAAMGGEPRFALVSLCVPEWADDKWVRSFFSSLIATGEGAGAVLAGGDLSRSQTLACDVTVCGAVPRGKALRRDGAKPGDSIYVSGVLGGSALGLERGSGKAWKRHVQPEPRLSLGRWLRGRATAAMDLSDGLSLDLHRLCLASGVSAEIAEPPLFPGATAELGLHGGEDYELLFAARKRTLLPASFDGVRITRIGEIGDGISGDVTCCGAPLRRGGHDHFAPDSRPIKGL